MDVDELAGVAASALALRLGSDMADPLVAVLGRRLQLSYIGKRVLAELRGNPTGAWQRELTTSVIADELSRGPVFERALTEALGEVAVHRHAHDKRFRIGPIRFGGVGLAVLIVAVALILAGAGYAVYRSLAASSLAATPVMASYTGVRGMPFDPDRPMTRCPTSSSAPPA